MKRRGQHRGEQAQRPRIGAGRSRGRWTKTKRIEGQH